MPDNRALRRLKRAQELLAGEASVRELAAQIGVSAPLLRMVYAGTRVLTPDVQLKLAAACRTAAADYHEREDKLLALADEIEKALEEE